MCWIAARRLVLTVSEPKVKVERNIRLRVVGIEAFLTAGLVTAKLSKPSAQICYILFHKGRIMGATVTANSFRSSRPARSTAPKYSDPILRRQIYGRIQPMEDDFNFLERLFGRR